MRTRDRDGALDQLLRRQARAAAEGDAAGPCLDAETLAAWADGGLKGYGQAMAEAHLAACARCQATLATLTRLSPSQEVPAREHWWAPFLNVRWLAPFAVGAVAVFVWIAMPSDRDRRPSLPQQATPARAPAAPSEQRRAADNRRQRETTTPAEPKDSSAAFVGGAEPQPSPPVREERALAKEANEGLVSRLDETSSARDAAAAQPAVSPLPPPAAASPAEELGAAKVASLARQVVGAREVTSSDPSVRWRVGPAGSVQHSRDGGATWETLPSAVTTDLWGVASPSPTVCWVVGRAGTVLLTTDGRRFQRIPFPASADLVSVRATDARSATVVSSDGRTFTTADGGATWEMNPR